MRSFLPLLLLTTVSTGTVTGLQKCTQEKDDACYFKKGSGYGCDSSSSTDGACCEGQSSSPAGGFEPVWECGLIIVTPVVALLVDADADAAAADANAGDIPTVTIAVAGEDTGDDPDPNEEGDLVLDLVAVNIPPPGLQDCTVQRNIECIKTKGTGYGCDSTSSTNGACCKGQLSSPGGDSSTWQCALIATPGGGTGNDGDGDAGDIPGDIVITLDEPFVYQEPLWWERLSNDFQGTRLKRCFKRQFPPEEGDSCATNPKTCFFGSQICATVSTHPEVKCICSGGDHSTGTFGTWSCANEMCPVAVFIGNN